MLLNLTAGAQFKFKRDRHFAYHADSLLLVAGINHPDFRKVEFEFRYWKVALMTGARELLIIRQMRTGTWNSTRYQFCYNDSLRRYHIVSQIDSSLTNWKQSWLDLVNENILTLPDEKIARKSWQKPDGSMVIITDGELYHFELITKRRKRAYNYENPDGYLATYGPNFPDLVDVNNIISTLAKCFGKADLDSFSCKYWIFFMQKKDHKSAKFCEFK